MEAHGCRIFINAKQSCMQFTEFLAVSLENLYKGEPWLGVTFHEHLSRMNALQAAQRVENSNTTWQIVNHVIFWHQHVTRFIQHEKVEQDGDLPDFYLPENHGEENWQATLHRLEHSFEITVEAIRRFPEAQLAEPLPGSSNPAIYYLQGLPEHDAYHLGQIVLLHKYTM